MKGVFCAYLIIFQVHVLFGQGASDYRQGLRINLAEGDEAKHRYLRFIVWNQIWLRQTWQNPGSAIQGQASTQSFDIVARRLRFLALAQLSPRYLILTHFGINNQSFSSPRKPQLYMHDCWNEYALILPKPDKSFSLSLGAGLHYWNGLSRMGSASTLNFMTLDAPISNWHNIDLSDQFARQLGIYAKGLWGNIDYRLALNKPFAINLQPPSDALGQVQLNRAVDNNQGSSLAYTGYAKYQFFDHESNLLPYAVGTYVGTKKILNLGLGFYHSPRATISYREQEGDTLAQRHSSRHLALDLFADLPFGGEKNWAFTLYSSLTGQDYGPGYERHVGISNIALADPEYKGQTSRSGFGNARPFLGTGFILYNQAGLLLPKGLLGSSPHRLQVFAAHQLMSFDYATESFHCYDFGFNYFIDGHHAKLSMQYTLRPLVFGQERGGYRGELIMQAQVFL